MAVRFNVKWLLEIAKSGEYIYGLIYEDLHKEAFFEPGKPKTKQYKLPISEQRMRRIKAIPLGFIFGRQAEAVAAEYGIPLAETQKMRSWWFSKCPELLSGYPQIEYQVNQKSWLRHQFRQIMHFPAQKMNEAINSCAQSDEAFVMMSTMIAIDEEFKRRQYKTTRVMLSVHDAISFNIGGGATHPERIVEVYEEVIKPIMERPISQLKGFQFKHEASVGNQWDWNTKEYWKWKKENCSGNTRKQEAEVTA